MSADNAAPVVVNEAPAEAPAAPTVFYNIESNDNVIVKMSSEAIKQTKTLNDLVSSLGVTNDSIPVNNVKGATLNLVAKWCEQHKGEPIPEDDDNVPKNITIPKWDEEFLKITNEALFDLICAANYLDIKGLMNYGCKTVANMAKGKSPEELRAIYGIPTDEEDEAAEKAAKEKADAEAAADKNDTTGPSTSASA